MRKVVVIEHLTLDGVMQAPGRPDEDTRGGFPHGGWAAARTDDVMGQKMGGVMGGGGPLLLGRRTYEDFYGFWPNQTDNPFTPALNAATKYVASTTLQEPLPWAKSELLSGDVAEAVGALRGQDGPDIVVLGSGELVAALLAAGQVGDLVLMIHPVVLGTGRRLFPEGSPPETLQHADTVTTTTGVVIATYRPAS
jgi:dihydrofolate reductase